MASKSVAVMDVRSSEVAVFVGEMGVNHTFAFYANEIQPYGGYQEGEFFNVGEFTRAALHTLEEAEGVCGKRFKTLFVGVPGEFMRVVLKEQKLSFSKRKKMGEREIDALYDSGVDRIDGYRLIRVSSGIFFTSDNRRVADPTGIYSSSLSGILSYFYCSDYFTKTMEQVFNGQKIELKYLPTDYAMAMNLLSEDQRDECAIFLNVGYLSSTIGVIMGGAILQQRTFWAGQGQIAVRLMERFRLPYEAAVTLLTHSNLYLKRDAKAREVGYKGRYYEIPADAFVEEVKAGLDVLCEQVSLFLESCESDELSSKPIFVTGEGLDGIRGALEHMSRRLDKVCEQLAPDLPYYNKPSMSSHIALIDMACKDNRASGGTFSSLFGG